MSFLRRKKKPEASDATTRAVEIVRAAEELSRATMMSPDEALRLLQSAAANQLPPGEKPLRLGDALSIVSDEFEKELAVDLKRSRERAARESGAKPIRRFDFDE